MAPTIGDTFPRKQNAISKQEYSEEQNICPLELSYSTKPTKYIHRQR